MRVTRACLAKRARRCDTRAAASMRCLRLSRQSQHDVLIVIAEPSAEDVDAAWMARVRLDLDPRSNRMVIGEVEIFRSQRRDSHAVDKRAIGRHSPALQHAVLAALQLPPVGGIKAALIAEIAGTVQTPSSRPLTATVMSDGQSEAVPGTSEESSNDSSSPVMALPTWRALFGNWYSTKPRVNHISPAFILSGSRKVPGTSSRPMIPLGEQRPQGALTSQLV